MALRTRVKEKLDRLSWVIPSCFGLLCLLLAALVTFTMLRGFDRMENTWMFSIGADLFCLAVCVMLGFSCMLNRTGKGVYFRLFVTMLTLNGMALFLDAMSWIVQGIPEYRFFNLLINVLFYANGVMIIFYFWRYVSRALDMNKTFLKIANGLFTALVVPAVALCFVNFFYPLYFSVDEAGTYQRGTYWLFSQMYLAVGLVIFIIGLIISKSSLKEKLVALSFIGIPMLNQLLTRYTFGLTTQYAASLVSIVLIYGVLFADREKEMASKENELRLANRIQADVLPSVFPPYPNRSDFEIFASMDPAKEVGGDFYDFFLIDDDHLGLVIADVSGKGVPAALFMMSSKMLIRNFAMNGISPKEVLTSVNEQICMNNREEMFVTAWFGSLDLRTGVLTYANAGHEYPALTGDDGAFELIREKPGFVLGGLSGMKYREFSLKMKEGSKLFLYTDGLAEANGRKGKLFGTDRLLQSLNTNASLSPSGILQAMKKDLVAFVKDEPQFDDLTMMCITYNGRERKEERE